ncbi:ribonuclease H-like protein [Gloeophyllum trabeum ATCC 11539]|uniref:ribonuclease H n=1 Tax=Gloeophyllum trabeum (strain ATCC 11539 / FP-39264 / Madison 617) TaxID=670483 RepID=S7PSE5_GLOTA|nr:ribonuclease H-like protein [Gloeophyllum trabeum ATCC 11539]EPQ50338.1 ribonuclease H-like protein [Gloeophyllum trabeum ATCC 11539]
MTVYTDGSCEDNGKLTARAGSGIYIKPDHPNNRAIRVPGPLQSNQVGELVAVIAALQDIPPFVPITIATDSMYVIDGLTKHLGHWEDIGWLGVANSQFFQAAAYQLRRRSARTSFQWVKGHDNNPGNEAADALAKQGSEKDAADQIDLTVPTNFTIQGAKLSCLTQAIAYRGVRARRALTVTPRQGAVINLDRTRYGLEEVTHSLETDQQIWLSWHNKNLRAEVRQFTHKALHRTQKVGDYWTPIDGYQYRAICPFCKDTTESMEHIWLECDTPERALIWKLAKQLWPRAHGEWSNLPFGAILGSGKLTLPPAATHMPGSESDGGEIKQQRAGASRLLQILVSESAYLIWTLRCQRVIQGNTHSLAAINTRWTNAINRRLTTDRVTAAKLTRKPKFEQTVANTWKGTLRGEQQLPKDWMMNDEVLVGIRTVQAS